MTTSPYEQRLHALDFHDLPEGHYALPVWEYSDDEDAEPPLLGHTTYQRIVARTTRNGKRRGRDAFRTGALIPAPGVDPVHLADTVRRERALDVEMWGPGASTQCVLDILLYDVRNTDTYRALFGQLTGHCGYCGRELTDPESKMHGIGPDCRGERGQRRAESLPDTPLTEAPAPSPLRRWTSKTAPEPGMKRTAHKTVEHDPAGHGIGPYKPEGEVCNSIFDRAKGGDTSRCPTPSVWRVSVTRGRRTLTAYWCDEHLPCNDRPADGPVPVVHDPADRLF